MSEIEPYLELEAEHEEEVAAHAVDLHVLVKGSSVFTGRAALSKAKEVNRLVEILKQAGAADADIRLRGVHTRLSSGFLGKSSEAEYHLVIRCQALDALSEWLGLISSQDAVELQQLEWLFPEQMHELLVICAGQLKQRAVALAEGLEMQLGPLLFCRELPESRSLYEYPPPQSLGSVPISRAKVAPVLNFQLQQVRRQKVRVQGRFQLLVKV